MKLLIFLLLIICIPWQSNCQVDHNEPEEFSQIIERVIEQDNIYQEMAKHCYHDTIDFPINSIFINNENTPFLNFDSVSFYKITGKNVYVMNATNLFFFDIPYFIHINQYKVSTEEIILGLNTICFNNFCDSLNRIDAYFRFSRKRLKIIETKISIE